MDKIMCEVCANEYRIFREASYMARGLEVCEDHFVELGV